MSDPTRLLDEPNASPALQELLGSARHDGPSAADLARLAKRLGPLLVATAPIGAAAATSAATGAATTKAAAATAIGTQVATATGAGVLKLTVIAAVGGTVIAAGSFQAGRSYESTRPPPPKIERVVVAPVAPPPAPVFEEPAPPPPVAVVEEGPKVAKPAPRPAIKAPPPEPKLTEVELLEKAMAEMKSGSLQTALALIQRHEREFASGALVQEREMLAIEGLVRLGKSSEARLKAESFRKKYPTSSHLLRLDALLK